MPFNGEMMKAKQDDEGPADLDRMRVARMEKASQLIKEDLERTGLDLRILIWAGLILLILLLITVPMDRYVSVIHSAF